LGSFEVLNPDDETAGFVLSYPDFSQAAVNLCGVLEIERRVWKHIAEGSSCLVETVLSTEKFFPAVDAAKRHSFRIRLIYCALPSSELALARIKLRVDAGGHDVPTDKVRSRWNESLNNFVRLEAMADEVVLFNNAGAVPEEIGYKNLNSKFVLRDESALPEITQRLKRAR
jgi:predicted ABC-type ATPase